MNQTSNKIKGKRDKKDFSYLMESPYVKKWIESYSNGQQQPRLSVLHKYSKFLDKTPDEIILEHHEDITKENPLDITNIGTNQLKAFYQYLIGNENNINSKIRKNKLTVNSARQYVFSKLPSFFRKNNVLMSFQKGDVPKEDESEMVDVVWRDENETMIEDQDLRVILKQIRDTFKNIRNKAILLCKISSGMDDVDLFKLKIKHYRRGYFPNDKICYLIGQRQKAKTTYQTFFNSEACHLIDMYLNERKKNEENFTNESWLFVSKKVDKNGNYKKLKASAFAKSLKETCEILGFQNITPKGFRRWFYTELTKKEYNIPIEIVERLMGHEINLSKSYQNLFKNRNALAKLYKEEIEPITILGNGNSNGKFREVNEELEKIKTENKELKSQIYDVTNIIKTLVKTIGVNKPNLLKQIEDIDKKLETPQPNNK